MKEIEELRREYDNCMYKLFVIGDVLISRAKELENRLNIMKIQFPRCT